MSTIEADLAINRNTACKHRYQLRILAAKVDFSGGLEGTWFKIRATTS
jgi:hypothetical protein